MAELNSNRKQQDIEEITSQAPVHVTFNTEVYLGLDATQFAYIQSADCSNARDQHGVVIEELKQKWSFQESDESTTPLRRQLAARQSLTSHFTFPIPSNGKRRSVRSATLPYGTKLETVILGLEKSAAQRSQRVRKSKGEGGGRKTKTLHKNHNHHQYGHGCCSPSEENQVLCHKQPASLTNQLTCCKSTAIPNQ